MLCIKKDRWITKSGFLYEIELEILLKNKLHIRREDLQKKMAKNIAKNKQIENIQIRYFVFIQTGERSEKYNVKTGMQKVQQKGLEYIESVKKNLREREIKGDKEVERRNHATETNKYEKRKDKVNVGMN